MGGGFKAPSVGTALSAFKSDPVEWNRLQLDPGGLFGASSNEVFAGAQGAIDIGGLGAKGVADQRAQDKQASEKQAKQEAEIARQSAEAQAAIDERRKRMMNVRQSGRASLLSGSELGVQGTTKTLG